MFANYNLLQSFCFCLSLSLFLVHSTSTSNVYIVYLGLNRVAGDATFTSKYHLRLLSKVFASEEDANGAMLYSYKHSFSGFSAKLNATQAMALSNMEEVISVFKSKTLQLHTTRSWDFLGLPLYTTTPQPRLITPLQLPYGDNVVVGVFDSGVWPESESFQEAGASIGPVPCTWKGKCVKAYKFDPASACNRKLIGARYYLKGFENEYGPLNMSGNPEFPSPRDFLGHGTHTASTAVGSIVKNVSFLGLLGKGIARGGAPRARLAVYKVCWGKEYEGKCNEADIMAAFDDALRDGVHVISASFGGTPPLPPFLESSAGIGSFHAMQRGVTVVFSAGNDGSDPSLVQNVFPWSICVAASSTDRTFPTQIVVDNRMSITGESLITRNIIKAKLGDAINYFMDGICEQKSRRPRKSGAGKVVLCFSTMGPVSIGVAQEAVKTINASALIFAAPMTTQLADVDVIPTVRIDITQATKLRDFLAELPRLATVEIGVGKTVIGKSPAPTVAYFSSRGPSSISPDILKPDISAPGVNILAAWPPETPPTVRPTEEKSLSHEHEHLKWNFQSGTSMSCPHITGVVALIKSAHPHWSPAAIRSAIITTATKRDSTHDTILAGGSMKASDPFDVGAGQVNPLRAMDPGLVYDIKTNDYIIFLCSMGYTEQQIRMLLDPSPQTPVCCPPYLVNSIIANLNYPSMTLANLHSTTTIKRTVRNVAQNKNAIYFLRVLSPNGVQILVWPRILVFSWFRQEISYYVTITPLKKSQGRYDFGEIEWSNGFHSVTIPLVVRIGSTCACA